MQNIDLNIRKGSTFRRRFRWLDANNNAIDISNYDFRMSIKKNWDDTNVVLSLTTANGLTVDTTNSDAALNNAVHIRISNTLTESLEIESGVYDMEAFTTSADGMEVTPVLKGNVIIEKEVT